MRATTLCYLERDGKWLLLHRVKKHDDENAGKWIGVGGKPEDGESPEDCVRRETLEETGYVLGNVTPRGIVTFVSDEFGTEWMHLFTSDDFTGEMLPDCDEGILRWVDKKEAYSLPLWEGDRTFLRLIEGDSPFFSMKLVYRGDELTEIILDGEKLK